MAHVKVSSPVEGLFPVEAREMRGYNLRNDLIVTKLLIKYSQWTQVPNGVVCVHHHILALGGGQQVSMLIAKIRPWVVEC